MSDLVWRKEPTEPGLYRFRNGMGAIVTVRVVRLEDGELYVENDGYHAEPFCCNPKDWLGPIAEPKEASDASE